MALPISQTSSRQERFVRLLTQHEATVRAYLRVALPAPDAVDDVMQETALVAWRKFESLDDEAGFVSWLCVIARYEALKYRRSKARDRLTLDESLIDTLLAESAEDSTGIGDRLALLDRCLKKLPRSKQHLVLRAYEAGRPVVQLAAAMGKSADALYQMLRRIRLDLLKCVESQLVGEVRR